MKAPRLLGDDVLRAASDHGAPEGRYHISGPADLFLGAQQLDPKALMVKRHEAAHFALNRQSVYGIMLGEVSKWCSKTGASEDADRLRALVKSATHTHEITATCAGVWGATSDRFDDLLNDYPTYQRYLSDARTLARGFSDGTFGAKVAAEQACRVAMSAPLNHLAPQREHWGRHFRPEELPAGFLPDGRIELLLSAEVDLSVFFSEDGNAAVSIFAGFAQSERNAGHLWYLAASEFVYDFFATILLSKFGLPTASFNGYIHEASNAIAAASQGGVSYSDHVALYATERVYIGDAAKEASVTLLSAEVPDPSAETPLLVVRPTKRLGEQYLWSQDDYEMVTQLSYQGFTTALRAHDPRTGGVRFYVIERPAQIVSLQESGANMVASICESSIGTSWHQQWYATINAHAGFTSLLDLPADVVARRLRDLLRFSDRERKCHNVAMKLTSGRVVAAALLQLSSENEPNPGYLQVAISAPETATHLVNYWCTELGAEKDQSLGGLDVFTWILPRLADQEPWFDFDAAPST